MDKEISKLEELIDLNFNNNKLFKIPFCVIYNLICEIAAQDLIENSKIDIGFLNPLVYIFSKNIDLTPLSSKESYRRLHEIQDFDAAFSELISLANLNIVFPFIHSGVYKLERINAETSTVNYTSDSSCRAELIDSILTQLSIPSIKQEEPVKDRAHWIWLREQLIKRQPPKVLVGMGYIEKQYESLLAAYDEAGIVPENFYTKIGFSSFDAFKKIRAAFCAICKGYMDANHFVHIYCKVNNLSGQTHDKLREGLAMGIIPRELLKSIVLKLSKVDQRNFENFSEFFFENGTTRATISRRFLPPFWDLNGIIYFSPGAAFMSMSTRNILISLQNHQPLTVKYDFHAQISNLFEPALLDRASGHFLKKGMNVCLEKEIPGTEIDMIVYCGKTGTVLVVQAKATLYPEGARMVKNLDSRIAEAAKQIKVFDDLTDEKKKKVINDCFPQLSLKPLKYIYAILTNASFGTFNSWEILNKNDITPINCNILRNTLHKCDSLDLLPREVEKFIENCVKLANHKILDKRFLVSDQVILQKNLDFDISPLYQAKMAGE